MLLFQHDKLVLKSIIFLVLILSSSIAFCQSGNQSVFTATKLDLDWGYAPKLKLVRGLKDEGGFLFRQDWWNIPTARRKAILAALKDAAKQGLTKLDCNIKEGFETLLNHPEKTNHSEILIEYCYIQEYGEDGTAWGMGSDLALNIIKIYPRIWAYQNGKCLNGAFLHELLHFAGFGEDIAYPCSHKVFPCVPLNPKYSKECKCPNGGDNAPTGSNALSRPDHDHPDDNYSSSDPIPVEVVTESLNPELLILKRGFWKEAGAYLNRIGKRFSYIEPDQSPLEMLDPPPILFIPSGGLFGLDASPQFRTILQDYVFRGGTLVVLSQQRGYEFKALPRGDEFEAYGWQEDISCFTESTFIDRRHPIFARITNPYISIPIDGYFRRIPAGSSVLLGRRLNGYPELIQYPYGEGTVVAFSSFDDYTSWWVGVPMVRFGLTRDLLTWALAPKLPIPEYNLKQNPTPTVDLNVEIENQSAETASSVKLIRLTPDRNVVSEEDMLVAIPPGAKIAVPVSLALSDVPDSNLGIWHLDYTLYDQDGRRDHGVQDHQNIFF